MGSVPTSAMRANSSDPSRRRWLRNAATLGAVGLAAPSLLWPRPAAACHTIPKAQGGCKADGSTSSGSTTTSSSSSASASSSSWTGPISASDMGRSPFSFLSSANKAWAVIQPFTPKNGSSPRLALAKAPDGRPSFQMNVPKGINWDNAFQSAGLGSRGVDAAILSLEMYLQSGFSWGTSNGKLGFGLWGGTGDLSGGVPVSQQKGFSVRNVRGPDSKGGGIALYSYHLNRTSGNFGQVSSQRSGGLAKGRWQRIEMEVRLNTVGQSNGYAKLRLDGKQVASMTGLLFRRDNGVGIRGLMFTDMWGGNEEDKVNWSPKAQKMWYSNYKLTPI